MKYDFDTIIDRTNTNSLKYDFALERGFPKDVMPFWVADMDFSAPVEVLEDMQKVVKHGIFGYTEVKEDYYKALINWFNLNFNYKFSSSDVVKTPGVVYAIAQTVCAYTEILDSIIIQTPVYYPFYEVIQDNNRTLIENPLIYKDERYHIDFDDFEQKIISNNVKMFILCSPHNPVGRVWTLYELNKINHICEKYNVIVVSDEIHCDFIHHGHVHTCFGVINENAIVITSPSKTFNIAGLQVANTIIKNQDLRNNFKKAIQKSGYSQLNTIGLATCQSAYTHGKEWLLQLKIYLSENIEFTRNFLKDNLPKIKLVEPEGTYLLWLDFSDYKLSQSDLDNKIIHDAKLWLDSGTMFGKNGYGFYRINIACQRSKLLYALDRLYQQFNF